MRLCSDALNDRCELGTGGVAGRCEYLARVALDEAGLGAVSDAVYCPRGDLRAVNESGNLVLVCRYIHAGQLALVSRVAISSRDTLRSGSNLLSPTPFMMPVLAAHAMAVRA